MIFSYERGYLGRIFDESLADFVLIPRFFNRIMAFSHAFFKVIKGVGVTKWFK